MINIKALKKTKPNNGGLAVAIILAIIIFPFTTMADHKDFVVSSENGNYDIYIPKTNFFCFSLGYHDSTTSHRTDNSIQGDLIDLPISRHKENDIYGHLDARFEDGIKSGYVAVTVHIYNDSKRTLRICPVDQDILSILKLDIYDLTKNEMLPYLPEGNMTIETIDECRPEMGNTHIICPMTRTLCGEKHAEFRLDPAEMVSINIAIPLNKSKGWDLLNDRIYRVTGKIHLYFVNSLMTLELGDATFSTKIDPAHK